MARLSRSRVCFIAVLAGTLGSLASSGCASSGVRATTPEPSRPEQKATLADRAREAAMQIPETAADAYRAVTSRDADEEARPADGAVETTTVPIAGTSLVRGRSTVLVKAPIARVRDAVLGFAAYSEFMPHYESCKVLGRTPAGARDVYMEISALHGALQFWARVEVPKPNIADGAEVHETRFVDGNVRDFKAIWRLRQVDDETTQLSLEVFLHPKLPMPAKLLNDENISGSAKGVSAMRKRAENRH